MMPTKFRTSLFVCRVKPEGKTWNNGPARQSHYSKSGKAYPQGLYTALKTANHFKTNFFPHEKKIITHLFSFSHPSYFFFFSLDAGLANQLKPRILQKISPGMCPVMHKKGANYLFTWALLIHLHSVANHQSSKCGKVINICPL
jgi:hypothetical protein